MSEIRLEPVPERDAGLKLALSNSGLPTEDLEDRGRSFFSAPMCRLPFSKPVSFRAFAWHRLRS